MKKNDIALIILVAVISAVLSVVISKTVSTKSTSKNQQAEIVTVITADFQEPDKDYFNSQAFDPTKQITIGQNANTDPFKGPGQ